MNSKLIVVASISAAVGAVVSWAITADHYDNILKDAISELEVADKRLDKAMQWLHEADNREQPVVINQYISNGEPLEQSALDLSTAAFETLEQADEVLTRMKALISSHGWCSVADFFSIIDFKGNFDDERKGWDNLDKTNIVELADGFALVFPREPHYHPGEPIPEPDPNDGTVVTIGAEDAEVVVAEWDKDSRTDAEEAAAEEPPYEPAEVTESNLRRIIDQYTANPEDHDEFVETAVKVQSEKNERPYVISQDEFAHGEDGNDYAKLTHTYYPAHRLLLDELDEPVAAIPYVIGWENLSKFGVDSNDPDTVFVRNNKMETDFEIVRETESQPPHHVQLGMGRDEYETNKAAGLIKPPRGWDDEG